MSAKYYLAMDFGASTGRGILGKLDGEKLELQEVHRFQNYYVPVQGKCYWDIFRLFHEILVSCRKAKAVCGGDLVSLGIDTWGTDYGLIDRTGQLIGSCRCMRNADSTFVDLIQEKITPEELFYRTGIQTIYGNTLFQLFEREYCKDPALKEASNLLMLPDLLAYFLTGEMRHEYTMVSTSMMYNHRDKQWDRDMLRSLGLPAEIYSDIVMPGTVHFDVVPDVLEETGLEKLKYVPVGTHDTASAVAAAPLHENEAFCSSGTWSLLGIELEKPIIDKTVYEANFSNEGTVDGGVRLLKNIMGMWILQQVVKELESQQIFYSWDEIVKQASAAEPFRSFIDVESPEFYQAGNMTGKIRGYCERSCQAVPQSVGELARCVYESLAMQYRITFRKLEEIAGHSLDALRIVGGGSQNRMLNQFAANAIGKPVFTGPVESACIGNLLVQAKEDGEIGSFREIRRIVENNFETEKFVPVDCGLWDRGFISYMEAVDKVQDRR